MKKLGYEEGKEESLDAERRTLSQDVHRLEEKLETLEARYVETVAATKQKYSPNRCATH